MKSNENNDNDNENENNEEIMCNEMKIMIIMLMKYNNNEI